MSSTHIVMTVANGLVIPGPDTGGTSLLDAASDAMVADVRGLTDIVASAIQVNDAGTATLLIEASYDFGVSYGVITGGTLSEASFQAGNNLSVNLGVSDARGMQMHPTNLRARLTAVGGGGTYSLAITGRLLPGHR